MDYLGLFYLLTLGWIILKTYWLFSDPRPFREILIWLTEPRNLFITVVDLVGAVILFLGITYFPLPKTPYDSVVIASGIIVYVFGWITAIWARHTMGSNWAPAHTGHNQERQKKLITYGPFRFSRNPIYVGLFLMSFGFLLALRSYLIPFVIIEALFFYKSVTKEEKLLEEYFGSEYLQYKTRTPRFLFF